MKTGTFPLLALLLVASPALADDDTATCAAMYVDAIKAMAAQYTSMTDARDRLRYARCQLEESASSSTDNGMSLDIPIPDLPIGFADHGGSSSTILKKSDCTAIRSRGDYLAVTRTVRPPDANELRELGRAHSACLQTNAAGRPYCDVVVTPPKVEVRLMYGTRTGEAEPAISKAEAIISDPKDATTVATKQLFSAGTLIPDKVPLSSSFLEGAPKRIAFDVVTSKGPVDCEAVNVNQAVAVYGRVIPLLRMTTVSTSRYSESVFNDQCKGYAIGGDRPIKSCVPEGATIVGHEFVDVPARKTDWKIIPKSTAFTINPNMPHCFTARASISEAQGKLTRESQAQCVDHIRRGTYFFVDVDYAQTSTVRGQPIDVANTEAMFPLEVSVPPAPADATVESIDFHLVVVNERGQVVTLTTAAPSRAGYSAMVPDGRTKVVINRGDSAVSGAP